MENQTSNIQYRTDNEPICTLYNIIPPFIHFITSSSASQNLNHKINKYFLKKGLPWYFPPLIIDNILCGIMYGIDKMGPLQLIPFLLAFNNPISHTNLNALHVQYKLGWTHLQVGRLNYQLLIIASSCFSVKNPTKEFHSLTKNILTYTLIIWQQYI